MIDINKARILRAKAKSRSRLENHLRAAICLGSLTATFSANDYGMSHHGLIQRLNEAGFKTTDLVNAVEVELR